MRQPPTAGPSAVECTATIVYAPERRPRRTTSSSWSSATRGVPALSPSYAMAAPYLGSAAQAGPLPGLLDVVHRRARGARLALRHLGDRDRLELQAECVDRLGPDVGGVRALVGSES